MIELRDVHRTFVDGSHTLNVLQGVDWDIEDGESIAVMGRSGTGKSTLLNLIGGLDRDYKGHITVNGLSLEKLSDRELTRFRNESIGLVFQSFHLMDQLTSEENVMLPTWFSGRNDDYRTKACELLERVGLGEKIGKYPNRMSGGEKQRIAIARALIMQPNILLCDEPTGNLDEQTSEEILDLFQQLHQEEGITLIMVTHDRRIAEATQKVVVLRNGLLEIEGEATSSPGPKDSDTSTQGESEDDSERSKEKESSDDNEATDSKPTD
ncbi:MAG: ABC transporter ATP-binding protein [Deltaproteobacteria bacterium]|nr:MAG: ABC transporter ATP-binding protein [Deltaproteobacteria bacterium]